MTWGSRRTPLTERERVVAELAATGCTNREIAQALHLSVKTVEWNLTKVYRLLGVRSRTELADVRAHRRQP
jgi:DNA-binding NarL/FixJ family response regulator